MSQLAIRLFLEHEDVNQDIENAALVPPILRIADIGCGMGYSTLCLMLALDALEATGIDKSPEIIQQAQRLLDLARKNIAAEQADTRIHEFAAQVRKSIIAGRFPVYLVDDILTTKNLSHTFDLAYCRKILIPIYRGKFGNPTHGDNAVKTALQNISRSVRRGGRILLVEEAGIDFRPFIEYARLNLLSCNRYQRFDITGNGRNTTFPTQYIQYLCQKL